MAAKQLSTSTRGRNTEVSLLFPFQLLKTKQTKTSHPRTTSAQSVCVCVYFTKEAPPCYVSSCEMVGGQHAAPALVPRRLQSLVRDYLNVQILLGQACLC